MRLSTPSSVQQLQRKLYRKSKTEPSVRFYTLWDKVCRKDVLDEAWRRVKANKGAGGVDGQTIREVEASGVEPFIKALQADLIAKTYKPMPVRRVWIPKASGGQRPLGIPAVRDRVAQMAVKIVLEPILDATFQDCSYGFRPKRGAHDAVREVMKYLNWGLVQVVDADIRDFFNQIPHERLLRILARKVADGQILKAIRQWLKCGIMDEGQLRHETTGTPQGGVISPLLANAYLNELDSRWRESGMVERSGPNAQMVRYADDLVVLTDKDSLSTLETLRRFLGDLGLELHPDKTRLVNADTKGFDFLGFHFRKVCNPRTKKRFALMMPSKKAQSSLTARIRYLTRRSRTDKPEVLVGEMNPVIRGWVNYFRIGNSSLIFKNAHDYIVKRLLRYVRRKQLRRGVGWDSIPNEKLYGQWGLYYDYRIRYGGKDARAASKGLR